MIASARSRAGRDVVVVGAGPAGSVSALLLARAGFDVVLLDRSEFPRPKACGDCLSPGANVILQRLGLWPAVLAAQPGRLHGWQLSAAADAAFSALFAASSSTAAPVSLALERARFDAILRQAAQAAGVEVRTGVRVNKLLRGADGRVLGVTATASGRPVDIPAQLTIGTDGLRSTVARLLQAYQRPPRLRKFSLTTHVRGVSNVTSLGEMHVRGKACLGIAPVETSADPLCNVTVVLPHDEHAPAQGAHALMRSALQRFETRDLSHLIRDDVAILASGPFDWPVRRTAFDGALLAGDAAGYFDPFTGQGIYQALAGAELLGEHAAHMLLQPATRARDRRWYMQRQRALVAPARRVQHVVDFVCARPRLAARVFRALAQTPPLAARLVAVTGDMRPVRDLLSPLLLARLLAASLTNQGQ